MNRRAALSTLIGMAISPALALLPSAAWAQAYPTKPIKLIGALCRRRRRRFVRPLARRRNDH